MLIPFTNSLADSSIEELEPMTVRSTDMLNGYEQSWKGIAASGNTITKEDMENQNALYFDDQLGRVPGVIIQRLGGEGLMSVMRHPPSPKAYVSFAENGITARGKGWFNHHLLNEINWQMAESLDIMKGPTSLLYGSENLSGVINYRTAQAPNKTIFEIEDIGGSFGKNQLKVKVGTGNEDAGIVFKFLDSRWDGWREDTAYDTQKYQGRADVHFDNGDLEMESSFTDYHSMQPTSSRVKEQDWIHNPTTRYKVNIPTDTQAFRARTKYSHYFDNGLTLSAQPYYSQTNTANLQERLAKNGKKGGAQESELNQWGIQLRSDKDFDFLNSKVILGFDYELSQGSMKEFELDGFLTRPLGDRSIDKTKQQYGAFYKNGTLHYDYSADYTTIAPHFGVEFDPIEDVRLNLGFRHDTFIADVDNHMAPSYSGIHQMTHDKKKSWSRFSPKLGITWDLPYFSDAMLYANYSEGFRAPAEGLVTRTGKRDWDAGWNIDPTVTYSHEVGLKASAWNLLTYNITLYHTDKENALISVKNANGIGGATSASGQTEHQGIELGWTTQDGALPYDLRQYGAFTWNSHKYIEYKSDKGDYSGNYMIGMPSNYGMFGLAYAPSFLNGGEINAEVKYQGETPGNDQNTWDYKGHTLLSLRGNYKVKQLPGLVLMVKIDNVTNERWAVSVGGNAPSYEPGLPIAAYGGFRYKF
jgi:outer membrane receptor protein involved in Fe transport